MLTVKQQTFVSSSSKIRVHISFDRRTLFILSIINLICKIIVFGGLLITIYSNHWAKNSIRSDIYTGYKTRCSVHICPANNMDPTWLIDLIFLLAKINLLMELINTIIIRCSRYRLKIIDILFGLMFILTFIITECGVVFGLHIVAYAYELPMDYAYYCFTLGIICSIIDWGCSLKRLVSDLPEIICLTGNELSYHSDPTTLIRPADDLSTIPEQDVIRSSGSVTYDDSIV